MKRLIALFAAALAAGVSFAYDWASASGTVTLTESAEITDTDYAAAAALTEIVLDGESVKLTFNLANDHTTSPFKCAVTGTGQIVLSGGGALQFSCPKLHTSKAAGWGTVYKDHFTTGGISVESGVLKLPQGESVVTWYGPVTMAKGTTLYTAEKGATVVDSLNGYGLVTNVVVPVAASDACQPLIFGDYGSRFVTDFKGVIGGGIKVQANAYVTLSNPASSFGGNVICYLCDSRSAEDLGILRTTCLGMRGNPSPLGVGTSYASWDITLDYGGKLFYLGEGETTDKCFRLGDYTTYHNSVIDAGPVGGVTFTGAWDHIDNAGKMDAVYLRGSNTQEMVLANKISTEGGKGGVLQFKKSGTGVWRVADHANRSSMTGAWFAEDGTLRYDSIANVGESCALGLATSCYPFKLGSAATVKATKLPYEIELGGKGTVPTFEYSGTNAWSVTTDRRIGLVGDGARVSVMSGPGKGRLKLLGGIFAAEEGSKTLYLDGAKDGDDEVGNISDGQGRVNVVKDGSGTWRLVGANDFSGTLTVKSGTLEVGARNYAWYRFTMMHFGAAHTAGADCTGSDYPYLSMIGLYDEKGNLAYTSGSITDYIPEKADLSGNTSYVYPSDFWMGLKPGQVTVGDFKGGHYRTYKATGRSLQSLFNESGLWATYTAGHTVSSTATNNWIPVVFRLPKGAPAVRYYDVCQCQSIDTKGHIGAFKLEGSVDGVDWTQLHVQEKKDSEHCAEVPGGYWFSTPTVKRANGQNCLTSGFGYPIASGPASVAPTTIAAAGGVMVAAGATLKTADAVELPALTVDCSAAGMGTIDGFTVAANGRINLVNLDKSNKNLVVPLTLSNCTGLENFADWEVYVNGASAPTGSWGAKVEADKVTVFAKGLSVIIR